MATETAARTAVRWECIECTSEGVAFWRRALDEGLRDRHGENMGHTFREITVYECASACLRLVEHEGDYCDTCEQRQDERDQIATAAASIGLTLTHAGDKVYEDASGRRYMPIIHAGTLVRIVRQRNKARRWSVDVGGYPGLNAITVWEG